MKTIIMATAFFFAGLGYVVAQTKPHHKKHHKVKHKTTAVAKKPEVKDDKVKTTATVKTKTDKKK